MSPYIYNYEMRTSALVYADMEGFLVPLLSDFRATRYEAVVNEETEHSEEGPINEIEIEKEVPLEEEVVQQVESEKEESGY